MFTVPRVFLTLVFFLFGFQIISAAGAFGGNPLLIDRNSGCRVANLDRKRFSADLDSKRQLAICQGIEEVLGRLNNGKWSAQLNADLSEIWATFAQKDVFFAKMPAGTPPEMLAMTESFPPGKSLYVFSACIFLKTDVEDKKWFYHVFLHELRHVYDFRQLSDKGVNLPNVELERRAFWLLSVVDEETPEAIRYSKVPQLWKDKWKELEPNLREFKRDEAIANFLKKAKFYKDLPQKTNDNPTVAIESNYDDEFGAPPKLRRRVPKNPPKDANASELPEP